MDYYFDIPRTWALQPAILPACFRPMVLAQTQPNRPGVRATYIVGVTTKPACMWLIGDPDTLDRAITTGDLRMRDLNRDNPQLTWLSAETTDALAVLAERQRLVRWLAPPLNELQRAILCVSHWKAWSILDHLPSHSFEWWCEAFCCGWSTGTLNRLRALAGAPPRTLQTLWRAPEKGVSVRAIERFIDKFSHSEQIQRLEAASRDPDDDSAAALKRASLQLPEVSGDSISDVIVATVRAWEPYGDHEVALATKRVVTRYLQAHRAHLGDNS